MGQSDPTRSVIAAIVSGIQRLTLEPIHAEDLFELTVEESGRWRSANRNDDVVGATDAARRRADELLMRLRDVPMRQMLAAVESADMPSPSLARSLILDGRRLIDVAPARATAMFGLAARLLKKADTVADLPRLKHLRGCALLEYANGLRHTGDYGLAQKTLDEADELLERSVASLHDLARAWYVRASIFYARSEFEQSWRFAMRARNLFEVLGDDRRRATCIIIAGGILFDQLRVREARDTWLEALEMVRPFRDHRTEAAIWMNLGSAEDLLGNPLDAKAWLRKAASAFKRMHARSEVIRAEWAFARVLLHHESPTIAIPLLRGVRRAFFEMQMRCEEGFAGFDLGEALLVTEGGASEAADLFVEVVQTFTAAGATKHVVKALAYLREATAPLRKTNTEEMRDAVRLTVQHVRKFIRASQTDPEVTFQPPTS